MKHFMFNSNDGEPGIRMTKTENHWSHLSLKSHVYQQPVFICKDGRKVSLNPKLMKEW